MDGSKAGRWLKTGLATAAMLVASGTASAQAEGDGSFFDGFLGGVDVSIGGFIRPEVAYSTSSYDNPNNQLGNTFNQRSIARQAQPNRARATARR